MSEMRQALGEAVPVVLRWTGVLCGISGLVASNVDLAVFGWGLACYVAIREEE